MAKGLCKIFNQSIKSNKFPSSWKISNVIPLFKKGQRDQVGNYRPVSLLCSLSKIFEKIVFKHLFNHLRDNFVLTDYQSGFLPGNSTVTQLIDLQYQFGSALNDKLETLAVFLDIAKAFDTVWHRGLLFKLKKCYLL